MRICPGIINFAEAGLTDEFANYPPIRALLVATVASNPRTQLELHSNALTHIPPCLTSIWAARALSSTLRELSLDHNNLTVLPAEIGFLTALENLTLHDNFLAELPAEIGFLTALQQLRLDRNRLRTLPDSIGNLACLTALHLDGNSLVALPASLPAGPANWY